MSTERPGNVKKFNLWYLKEKNFNVSCCFRNKYLSATTLLTGMQREENSKMKLLSDKVKSRHLEKGKFLKRNQ